MLTFGTVCSGIEAPSVAWEPLGMKPKFFCEIDEFPSRVLAARFPHVPNLGDFTAIDVAALPHIDVLAAGTPCQAFSIAGKRLSLADARGNLTLAFAVLAHEIQDKQGSLTVVWENVPGVLTLDDDNAFGCFLGALVGGRDAIALPRGYERWPDHGLVAGPRGRLVWRVLDAQWFGLAQRRERVFVVADLGAGIDPAAVLLEPKGMPGDRPACVEARTRAAARTARTARPKNIWGALAAAFRAGAADGPPYRVAASLTASDGGLSKKDDIDGRVVVTPIAEIGKRASIKATGKDGDGIGKPGGPMFTLGTDSRHGVCVETVPLNDLDGVSHALNGKASASGYMDASVATYIGQHVAHTLRADGFDASEDGTGRDTPIVSVPRGMADVAGTMPASGGTERKHGHGWGQQEFEQGYVVPVPRSVIAFDTTQITSPENRSNPRHGDPAPTLVNDAYAPPAVAFRTTGNDGCYETGSITAALTTGTDQSAISLVEHWDVRRLTVVECERLQGFPDNWTLVEGDWRERRPEDRAETVAYLMNHHGFGHNEACALADCPDGPRYKAIGNSMATRAVRWIGERIKRNHPKTRHLP